MCMATSFEDLDLLTAPCALTAEIAAPTAGGMVEMIASRAARHATDLRASRGVRRDARN